MSRDARDGDGDGGFLGRWSRRKALQRRGGRDDATPAPGAPLRDIGQRPPPAPIDPAGLPDIESLTAESDFGTFLRPGVPDALRTAALRKLYLTEPSVVNYEPLVEYGWNFTAPGYGDLLPSDDVAKMLGQIVRSTLPSRDPETAADAPDAPPPAPSPVRLAAPAPVRQPGAASGIGAGADAPAAIAADSPSVGPTDAPDPGSPPPARRRHGGALPG